MMKNNRKGQAALEFLTTYGWAFLVILVMIGALGYFGILNPSNLLPNRCNVGPEFNCDEYQATIDVAASEAYLSVIFVNQLGEPFGVNNGTVSASFGEVVADACYVGVSIDASGDVTNDQSDTNPANTNVSAGGDYVVRCQWNDVSRFPPTGDKVRFDFNADYLPTGATFTKPIAAEVFTTLQEE